MSATAQCASLDELYRDLVKSDNDGYLPMFVKNRHAPENLLEAPMEIPAAKPVSQATPGLDLRPIDLVNEYKAREAARLQNIRDWENAVKAVQQNRVTPVELKIITSRTEKKDPKAIEIYAWMNAKGVGVKQDLIQAFHYYMEADRLNVADAKKNASLVYQAMSKDQRASLSSL